MGKARCQAGWAQPGSITCFRCNLRGLRLRVGAQGPGATGGAEVLPGRGKAALTLVKKEAKEAGLMVMLKG